LAQEKYQKDTACDKRQHNNNYYNHHHHPKTNNAGVWL